MQSRGVDWWGFMEGNADVLAALCLLVLAFAGAYLVQRFRGASIRAERQQRKAR